MFVDGDRNVEPPGVEGVGLLVDDARLERLAYGDQRATGPVAITWQRSTVPGSSVQPVACEESMSLEMNGCRPGRRAGRPRRRESRSPGEAGRFRPYRGRVRLPNSASSWQYEAWFPFTGTVSPQDHVVPLTGRWRSCRSARSTTRYVPRQARRPGRARLGSACPSQSTPLTCARERADRRRTDPAATPPALLAGQGAGVDHKLATMGPAQKSATTWIVRPARLFAVQSSLIFPSTLRARSVLGGRRA